VVCTALGGGALKRHFKELTVSIADKNDLTPANLDCLSPRGKESLKSQIFICRRFPCQKSKCKAPSIVFAVSWHLPDVHPYIFSLLESALINWNQHCYLSYLAFSCFDQTRTLLLFSCPIELQRCSIWVDKRWATASDFEALNKVVSLWLSCWAFLFSLFPFPFSGLVFTAEISVCLSSSGEKVKLLIELLLLRRGMSRSRFHEFRSQYQTGRRLCFVFIDAILKTAVAFTFANCIFVEFFCCQYRLESDVLPMIWRNRQP
jgi:hypothetical protein